ncbi:MAG: hypothetical protein B7Z74_03350 [Deltaproteobacteria bacterium 21-66-5]|nr:MAG: hypothetical protein B7Z74_03350 [Deltaproteobacteria bacterium 21-66-5]HQU45331.1 RNA polymerase sigma factor [Pirellulales bacterium]
MTSLVGALGSSEASWSSDAGERAAGSLLTHAQELLAHAQGLLAASASVAGAAIDLTSLSQDGDGASPVSEADWSDIAKTLGGDGQAYAQIVRRYQDQITAQMWRLSRQRADCEQLVHEVFVEAYLSLRAFKGRAPLLHWLRRIATRVGYRYWKEQARARRQAGVSIQDWHRSVEPVNNDAAEQAAVIVHSVLGELPPRDRLVLTLLYLEGCSVAEAADRSGWSQTMVKVQAHRARKKLKKLLDERQIDESIFER